MFYDVGLNEDFKDFAELSQIECAGFCIAQTSSTPIELPSLQVPVYSRIDIEFEGRLDSAKMAGLRKQFNVICIVVNSLASLPCISKLGPDIIQIPVELLRHVKKTLPGLLNENGIYVEVSIRDGLYGQRVPWMNGIRRLLRLGARKMLVISSGAKLGTELKGKNDVLRILDLYGVSGDQALAILDNTERMLRCAALKRYTCNHTIAVSTDQGPFKRDFILNYDSSKRCK